MSGELSSTEAAQSTVDVESPAATIVAAGTGSAEDSSGASSGALSPTHTHTHTHMQTHTFSDVSPAPDTNTAEGTLAPANASGNVEGEATQPAPAAAAATAGDAPAGELAVDTHTHTHTLSYTHTSAPQPVPAPPKVSESMDPFSLAHGLVREYLHRHTHTRALALLDEAAGRSGVLAVGAGEDATGDAAGDKTVLEQAGSRVFVQPNTSELVAALRLVKLYKKYQAAGAPFRSVLEVLAAVFLHEVSSRSEDAPDVGTVPASPRAERLPVLQAECATQAERARANAAEAPRAKAPSSVLHTTNNADARPEPLPAILATDPESTCAPTAPGPAPAAAGGSFWERLNSAKAPVPSADTAPAALSSAKALAPPADTAPATLSSAKAPVAPADTAPAALSSAKALVPPADSAPAALSSAKAPAPPDPAPAASDRPLALTSEQAAGPSVSGASGSSTSTAGGGFWARLNATKAVQSSSAHGNANSSTAGCFETALGDIAAAPAPPTVPSVPTGALSAAPPAAGSFWARLASTRNDSAAAAADAASRPTDAGTMNTMHATGFRAPDGTWYRDRSEYTQAMFERDFTFAEKMNETLTKRPGQISGQPFALRDLQSCIVRLCDWSDAMHVDRLVNCRVLIGACCESVFLRNCRDCTFYIACKQLRTRDCSNCTISLYSKTDPVIERSWAMAIGSFAAAFPGARRAFEHANLPPQVNHWDRVFDFSKDDATLPRPHWQVTDDIEPWNIDGIGDAGAPESLVCENPTLHASQSDSVPEDDAGANDGMLTFDIRTVSQSAAQAAIEAQP